MSSATATKRDVRTLALVLRRVNYGEADRILDLITPQGLVAVMAKGVRREKSKLAGGIELFCLSEITYHQNKQEGLAILTSAKMQKFYQNIMKDFAKMEFAAEMLKKISQAAEHTEGPEFFNLAKEILESLNSQVDLTLIETYFWLNFASIKGEAVNLSRDSAGDKLVAGQTYAWDNTELAFTLHPQGKYSTDEIKFLRLMLSGSLLLATRVKYPASDLPKLLFVSKSINQI